jgi:glycosyltransferase involved in cell wall biosynthesis
VRAPRVSAALPVRKRLAHRLKAALYRHARLDAWLDDRIGAPARGPSAVHRGYLRLVPERAVRRSPLTAARREARRGSVLVLTLVPPEDVGGGSRPAQLAAALHRRGFAIDWRYALPIFPWPRLRRPPVDGVDVRFLGEPPRRAAGGREARETPRTLALVEAPHPLLLGELDALSPSTPVLYDAIDVWDGALGAGWFDAPSAARVAARADALLASSALLRDELARATGREVTLLPNAVDARLFDPDVPRATPSDLRRGTPTVVFVGSLWGEWVDLELVAALARDVPQAQIHLIGPTGTRPLPAAPNLHVLGLKAQDEIPAYLGAADVALVPFRRSRLSDAVSPLKLFEYLAMRCPVVATPLPEVAGLPGVTTADGAAAFAAAVRAADRSSFPRAAAAALVARETWDARVDALLALAGRGS